MCSINDRFNLLARSPSKRKVEGSSAPAERYQKQLTRKKVETFPHSAQYRSDVGINKHNQIEILYLSRRVFYAFFFIKHGNWRTRLG